LLNAIISGNNRDVNKVKFQYKKSTKTQWQNIGENDIATGTTVTFILKEQELPYLQIMNGVSFSRFTEIKLDFTWVIIMTNMILILRKEGDV
jgi:hypothetical protein